MARPERNNIDYFPHPVKHGKKMSYIEKKYKNDGYAVWMKLLEELGDNNYHYLNLSDEVQLMFLEEKCNVNQEILLSIINDLVKLDEFNKELWEENKILFNEKFIETIKDAYNKRNNNCISLDGIRTHLISLGILKQGKCKINGVKKPQTKVDYTKVKESIYSHYPSKCKISGRSLGKSKKKDLDKIGILLKSMTEEKIIKTIDLYIDDCIKSNTYMKNFSTFLNNIPDYDESHSLNQNDLSISQKGMVY